VFCAAAHSQHLTVISLVAFRCAGRQKRKHQLARNILYGGHGLARSFRVMIYCFQEIYEKCWGAKTCGFPAAAGCGGTACTAYRCKGACVAGPSGVRRVCSLAQQRPAAALPPDRKGGKKNGTTAERIVGTSAQRRVFRRGGRLV